MSFYEEFVEEHVPEWDNDVFYEELAFEIEENAKKRIWKTRDGTMIPVSKMTESHIKNAINYIKRNDDYDLYGPWLNVFKEELEYRKLF